MLLRSATFLLVVQSFGLTGTALAATTTTSAAPSTSSDINNCGSVGNKCADNQYCVSGSCVPRKNLCNSAQYNTGRCSKTGCACWGTTEVTEYCASGQGPSKGGPCNNSRDCPNGQSCLDIKTFDNYRGVCAADGNLSTCPN